MIVWHLLSVCDGGVWNPDDILGEGVDGLCVDVVDPLVGRLPDNDPDDIIDQWEESNDIIDQWEESIT